MAERDATTQGPDRLTALAAERAADSLAQLAGCRLRSQPVSEGRSESRRAGPWEAGLFVEVEGGLGGVVGLLLAPGGRDALAKALLRGAPLSEEAAESALRELGNIVASQALSAIADELGGRLLPSVPIFAARAGESALAAAILRRGAGPEARRFECLMEDASSGLRVLFVLALDRG